MIAGIGCDVVAVARFEKILSRKHAAHFMQRVFAPKELALFGMQEPQANAARIAANFAAKEAFVKAMQGGISAFALCEIAALRKENGAPYYQFYGKAAEYMAEHQLVAHLSISHEKELAFATCLLETMG